MGKDMFDNKVREATEKYLYTGIEVEEVSGLLQEALENHATALKESKQALWEVELAAQDVLGVCACCNTIFITDGDAIETCDNEERKVLLNKYDVEILINTVEGLICDRCQDANGFLPVEQGEPNDE